MIGNRWRWTAGAALTAALALTGCDDATAPEELPAGFAQDVATMVAEATVDDIEAMRLAGIPLGVTGETASAAVGGLAPGDRLTREWSRSFFDASGAEMDAFDPLLTESIVTVATVVGELSRPRWSASLDRERETRVSGLAGEESERVWNGTAHDRVERTRFTDERGDRSYSSTSQRTIENVVVGVPRSDVPWPLSGTITHELTITIVNGPDGDVTRERTVVVTFDGTRFVTVTVNGEAFEVDLADRSGARPRRR